MSKEPNTFEDYSQITSEGSIGAFQTSRVYHTEHHLPHTYLGPQLPQAQPGPVQAKRYKFKARFYGLLVLAICLLGLFVGIGLELTRTYILNQTPEVQVKYTPTFSPMDTSLSPPSLSTVDIANHLEASLVAITKEEVQETFFGQSIGESTGSGIIFDISTKYIYILTNNHVIENASSLYVSFFGEKVYKSTLVGGDADSDLAVITIEKSTLPPDHLRALKPVIIGNSDTIEVGETAIAIGNPLGYNNTVTVGVISALNRIISNDLNALSLIQTDAAINPGNSGGALVNDRGQLIGINTIKISDTSVEGIGFAIPINAALPILYELMDKGYISKPYIGIYGQEVSKATAALYKIPLGVVISDFVPSGPGFESDLKVFDIIIEVEGQTVESMADLTQEITKYAIGDTIKLTVMRESSKGFKKKIIEVTVKDRHKK